MTDHGGFLARCIELEAEREKLKALLTEALTANLGRDLDQRIREALDPPGYPRYRLVISSIANRRLL